MNRSACILVWGVLLASGVLACGTDPPGGLEQLAHYAVSIDATDAPDINSKIDQRALMFQFQDKGRISSPQLCASLARATAHFGDREIPITSPGGWHESRIPTGTGETIKADACSSTFIEILFDRPHGEPQNGTLDLVEGATHFAVPFDHAFGSPNLSLVSASREQMVVRLQDFPVMPTVDAIWAVVIDFRGSARSLKVREQTLNADGLLQISIDPADVGAGPLDGDLGIRVDLGRETIPCPGFVSCMARSSFSRHFRLEPPRPSPPVTPVPTLPPLPP